MTKKTTKLMSASSRNSLEDDIVTSSAEPAFESQISEAQPIAYCFDKEGNMVM